MRRLLLPLAAAAVLAPAAPARADDLVAELRADTPIAAYGGVLAWSDFDAATRRYRLMILRDGAPPVAASVAPSRGAFDVSLGPDARGRTIAVYSRCRTASGRGCDLYRYAIATGRETRLRVSSPHEDEAWPAQWRDTLVFVRRHRTGSRGELPDCDVPYAKDLRSAAPSRRLDRGSCARTTGMSLRGERIVEVTFGSPPNVRFDSQIRLLSTRGGAVRVLAHQGSGEESNYFDAPNQSASAIFVARSGINPQPTFGTIDLRARTPRLREVRAHTPLTGAIARDPRSGAFWYVEGTSYGCFDGSPAPCRLARASASPFSTAQRALLPTLTITSPAGRLPSPLFGDPFVLSGRLTRTIVRRGALVRRVPLAGVPVTVLRRFGVSGQPADDTFEPTGIVEPTDADGRWSHAIERPPAQPWYAAVAAAADVPRTYTRRATAGSVQARIALTVSGTTFSGTIAPAQPGRVVHIQRLLSRHCTTARSGQRFCDERWATVADVPVEASGTAFSTTITGARAGTYSAALAFADQHADPTAYAGRSPDVAVG